MKSSEDTRKTVLHESEQKFIKKYGDISGQLETLYQENQHLQEKVMILELRMSDYLRDNKKLLKLHVERENYINT